MKGVRRGIGVVLFGAAAAASLAAGAVWLSGDGALAQQQGNISRTADVLGIERSNLYRKMRGFGIGPKKSEEEIEN